MRSAITVAPPSNPQHQGMEGTELNLPFQSSGSGFFQPKGNQTGTPSHTRSPGKKGQKEKRKKVQISQGRATRVDAEPTDRPPHFVQIPPLFPHSLPLFLFFLPHPSNKQAISPLTLSTTTTATTTKQGLFSLTNYQTSS